MVVDQKGFLLSVASPNYTILYYFSSSISLFRTILFFSLNSSSPIWWVSVNTVLFLDFISLIHSSFQEGEIERGFVDHSLSLWFQSQLQLIRRRRSVNGIGSKARMIVKCPMFQLLNRCSRCRGPSGSFNRFRIKGTWPKKRFLRKKQGAEVRDEDHWLWWLGLVAANPTLIGTNLFNRYGKEALKRIFL